MWCLGGRSCLCPKPPVTPVLSVGPLRPVTAIRQVSRQLLSNQLCRQAFLFEVSCVSFNSWECRGTREVRAWSPTGSHSICLVQLSNRGGAGVRIGPSDKHGAEANRGDQNKQLCPQERGTAHSIPHPTPDSHFSQVPFPHSQTYTRSTPIR